MIRNVAKLRNDRVVHLLRLQMKILSQPFNQFLTTDHGTVPVTKGWCLLYALTRQQVAQIGELVLMVLHRLQRLQFLANEREGLLHLTIIDHFEILLLVDLVEEGRLVVLVE